MTASNTVSPAQPLYSIEAEESLVGSGLIDPDVFVKAEMQPFMFHQLDCGEIWAAALELVQQGITPDLVTLPDTLIRRGSRELPGDIQAKLTKMIATVPTAVHFANYAATIKDYYNRREANRVSVELARAVTRKDDFDKSLTRARDRLDSLTVQRIGPVKFCTADEISSFYGQVTWAWDNWIPTSHLTMIAGPQGHGKSYLAARVIATLTGSLTDWPDGTSFAGPPGKVLVVETEQLRGAYVERLDRMGVDRQWYIFGPGNETHIADLAGKESDQVEKLARDEQAIAIIVDSLSGGHSLDENGPEMRRLLQKLAAMASRLRLPIILVHHPRKRNTLEPVSMTIDRIRGSGTITQFCRSILACYRLEENDQTAPVRLESLKSTFCLPPKPIGFVITNNGLEFCEPPEPETPETKLEEACEFLQDLLAKGPVAQVVIKAESKRQGISWATILRAKNTLNIVDTKKDVLHDGQPVYENGRKVKASFWGLLALQREN